MHLSVAVIGFRVAAELHAGVQPFVYLEAEFEDEISVCLIGAKERIGRIDPADADDRAVFDAVFGRAVQLFPSFEVLSVEQGLPVALGEGGCAEAKQAERYKQFFHQAFMIFWVKNKSPCTGTTLICQR